MDFFSELPWLALLISTVLSFVLASLWYSPLLFLHLWKDSLGLSFDDGNPGLGVMIKGFVAMMITTICFAALASYGDARELKDYLGIALVLWLGFPLMESIGAVLWARFKPSFIFVSGGYSLLSLVITAIIFAWLV